MTVSSLNTRLVTESAYNKLVDLCRHLVATKRTFADSWLLSTLAWYKSWLTGASYFVQILVTEMGVELSITPEFLCSIRDGRGYSNRCSASHPPRIELLAPMEML